MKPEKHFEAFIEHKESIFEWALKIKGLKNSQRIVGLHSGRGIVELLSWFLESAGKIKPGMQINHRWFKSQSVGERFPDFPNKKEIIEKLILLETLSENLSYGSPKSEDEIKKVLVLFNELEKIIMGARNGQI